MIYGYLRSLTSNNNPKKIESIFFDYLHISNIYFNITTFILDTSFMIQWRESRV